jgi:SOS-response transcriptional repressor LexA
MTGERATKKQQVLLEFVDQFIKAHDYGPSYREICSALGYKSVSTVAVHVEALIAKGFLERKDNSARSLQVVGRVKSDSSEVDMVEGRILKKVDLILSETKTDKIQNVQTLIEALRLLGYEKAANRYSKKISEKAE